MGRLGFGRDQHTENIWDMRGEDSAPSDTRCVPGPGAEKGHGADGDSPGERGEVARGHPSHIAEGAPTRYNTQIEAIPRRRGGAFRCGYHRPSLHTKEEEGMRKWIKQMETNGLGQGVR